MTQEMFNLIDPVITTISLSGLVALMFWWGVKPFIPLLVSYFTGKLTEKSIEKNLMECFEGNHLSSFREDIAELKRDSREIKERLLKIEIKLSI